MHLHDLLGTKCFVLIIQPVTIPLKKINIVGVHDRLGMEKELMKLSIIVLNGPTILAQLPEHHDEVHHIRCITQFSNQCRMDFGPRLCIVDVVEHVCLSRSGQLDAKKRACMRDIVTGAHEELIHLGDPSRELTGVRRVKDWYSAEHFTFEVLHAVIVSVREGSIDRWWGWRGWGAEGGWGLLGGGGGGGRVSGRGGKLEVGGEEDGIGEGSGGAAVGTERVVEREALGGDGEARG